MDSLAIVELGDCTARILELILLMMLIQMPLGQRLGGPALLPHHRNLQVRRGQRDFDIPGITIASMSGFLSF
jgi:hypothetical protein